MGREPTGPDLCRGAGHALRLYRLDGAHYVEDQVAKPGEEFRLAEPIRWRVDPATLR
ncbi:hypothetical protein [Micromonospora sp. DT62]|uniref:hypothetical protein n=1 Tax=Micromonospora sp. DT62 TaxID=3416521 RepID=UPI003CEBAB22